MASEKQNFSKIKIMNLGQMYLKKACMYLLWSLLRKKWHQIWITKIFQVCGNKLSKTITERVQCWLLYVTKCMKYMGSYTGWFVVGLCNFLGFSLAGSCYADKTVRWNYSSLNEKLCFAEKQWQLFMDRYSNLKWWHICA